MGSRTSTRTRRIGWRSRWAVAALLASSFLGCNDATPLGSGQEVIDHDSDATVDRCEGVSLPPCPPACAPDAFERCGSPCETEGEACGNELGDGMRCIDGTWQCFVHEPGGEGCNLVCRADSE